MGRPIVISSSATSPRQSLSGNAGGSEASPANNTGDGSRRELDAELQVLRDSRRSLRDAAAIGNGQQPAMQQRRPQEGQMSKTQPSSHAAVLTAAGALTSDAPASDGTAANHSNGHGQSSSSSSSDAPPDLSEAEVLARVAFLKEVFVQWDKGWDEQALRNLARVMRAKTFGAYETVVRQDGHAETLHFIRSGSCRVIKWVSTSTGGDGTAASLRNSGVGPEETDSPFAAAAAAALNQDSFNNGSGGGTPSGSFVKAQGGSFSSSSSSKRILEMAAAEALRSDGEKDSPRADGENDGDGETGKSSNGAGVVSKLSISERRRSIPESILQRLAADELGSRGTLATSDGLSDIEPVSLCELGRAKYFGELGLILSSGHTASVVTCTPVELLMLSKSDWRTAVPGRTRCAMVKQMLSHAQVAYKYKSLQRSISIGLADESLLDVHEEERGFGSSSRMAQLSRRSPDLVPAPPERSPPRPSPAQSAGNGSVTYPAAEGGIFWPQVLPLYTPSLVQATAMGLLIPVLPLRALSLTSAESVVGAVVSGRGTGLIVGGPIAGFAIAALGLRDGIVIGLLLSCVSAIFGGVSVSVWPLLATRVLAGIGLSFFQVGRQMYVSICIPPTSRGMASSLIAGTTRLGTTIGPAVGGLVAERWSTTAAFWLEGVLFACAAVVIATYLTLPPGRDDENRNRSPKPVGWASCFGSMAFSREAMLTAPVLIILSFARATRELLLPLRAKQLGASPSEVGAITAASFAIDTALVPLAGCVMDRHGRRTAGVPALGLSAFGLALVAIAPTTPTLLGAGLVLGMGMGMSNGWIQTVGADLAPAGSRPQFLGMWNLLMGLGTAIGPLAVGAIAQVRNVQVASMAAAIISAIGCAWYIFLGVETLPEREAVDLL